MYGCKEKNVFYEHIIFDLTRCPKINLTNKIAEDFLFHFLTLFSALILGHTIIMPTYVLFNI